jgi:hypothetical protein
MQKYALFIEKHGGTYETKTTFETSDFHCRPWGFIHAFLQ